MAKNSPTEQMKMAQGKQKQQRSPGETKASALTRANSSSYGTVFHTKKDKIF